MADKIIKELSVLIEEKGASDAADNVKKLSEALEDTAAGAELSEETIKSLSVAMKDLAESASDASSSMGGLAKKGGMADVSKVLADINDSIIYVIDEIREFHGTIIKIDKEADTMSKTFNNNLLRSIEDVGDGLTRLYYKGNDTTKGLADIEVKAKKTTRAIGDTSGSARGATRDFAALSRITGPIPMLYGALASNVWVLQQAFEKIKLGDQVNKMNRLGVAMGKITGQPTQVLANSLRDATGEAISFENAMDKALKASMLGVTSGDLEKLGKVASRAAAAGFASIDDALNRVIKGVTKLDVASLEGAGIIINLNDAYATYARLLNETNAGLNLNSQSLTQAQKKQAVMNAVLEQSNNQFGKLDDTIKQSEWDRLGAQFDSITSRMQAMLAADLENTARIINDIGYSGGKIRSAADNFGLLKHNINSISPSKEALVFFNTIAGIKDQQSALTAEFTNLTKQREESLRKLEEFNRREKQIALTSEHNKSWLPASNTQVAKAFDPKGLSDEYKKLQSEVSRISQDLTHMAKAANEFKDATNSAYKAAKESGSVMADLFTKMDTMKFGDTVLTDVYVLKDGVAGVITEVQSLEQFAKGANTEIEDAMDNLSDSNRVIQAQRSIQSVLDSNAKASDALGESWIGIAEKMGLSAEKLSYLNREMTILNSATKAYDLTSSSSLEEAKERYELAKKTGNAKQISALKARQEADSLDQQIQVERSQMNLLIEQGKDVTKQKTRINQLEAKRYDALTQSLIKETGTVAAVKDIKDLSEKIALVNDRTLSNMSYALRMKEVELNLNARDLELYKGKADKQNEYQQALLNEAIIRRDIANMNREEIKKIGERNIAFRTAIEALDSSKTEIMQTQDLIRQRELQYQNEVDAAKAAGVAASIEDLHKYSDEIEIAKAKLEQLQLERQRGYGSSMGSLLGGSYQSMEGMEGDARDQMSMLNDQSGWQEAISNLQAINSEATNVAMSIGNAASAFGLFAAGAIDGTTAAAAGMQMVSSVISYSANQHASAIDNQIKAEQARDGKSEESKAKIKKLEAEKIKVQQESAKKQILIQTALGAMQAWTALPFPFNIPLVAATLLAGAMAYSQASNPTSPSMGDAGTGTTGYLKLGERDRNIDVSKGANQGELSYLRGDQGTGSAQNFIPRAEGGMTLPGVGYVFGEHGVEVRTPDTAGNVVPNDALGQTSSSGGTNIHIHAIDAQSFADALQRNSEAVTSAIETSLNERGTSLEKLSN